jgi:peptide/nickel transport system permease protein
VLVLLCGTIFGRDPAVLAISAGVSATPGLARAIAERIERLRLEEFVLASRAHGLSPMRILLLHLVAIASGRAIARHLVGVFGAFMVLECTLSYLGHFGVQEPTPSWGNMLAFDWERAGIPELAPGLAIWATLGACALAARLFAEVDDE